MELPSADSTMLQLHGMDEEDLGTMSLSQALQHIKPRSHLSQNKPQLYQIKPLKIPHTDRAPVAGRRAGQKMFKRLGRSKDFPLTTAEEPSLLQDQLGKAYGFLLLGSRIEFRLRPKSKPSFLKNKTVDWALEHALHLRPDSILAAMPEGSTMLAKPCTAAEQSTLMGGIEHPPSLERVGVRTPKWIYRLGTWEQTYQEDTRHDQPVGSQRKGLLGQLMPSESEMIYDHSGK